MLNINPSKRPSIYFVTPNTKILSCQKRLLADKKYLFDIKTQESYFRIDLLVDWSIDQFITPVEAYWDHEHINTKQNSKRNCFYKEVLMRYNLKWVTTGIRWTTLDKDKTVFLRLFTCPQICICNCMQRISNFPFMNIECYVILIFPFDKGLSVLSILGISMFYDFWATSTDDKHLSTDASSALGHGVFHIGKWPTDLWRSNNLLL